MIRRLQVRVLSRLHHSLFVAGSVPSRGERFRGERGRWWRAYTRGCTAPGLPAARLAWGRSRPNKRKGRDSMLGDSACRNGKIAWIVKGRAAESSRPSAHTYNRWIEGRAPSIIGWCRCSPNTVVLVHLHRIGREPTARCHHCGRVVEDTAIHTLEVCPAWAEDRRVLQDVIGEAISLRTTVRAIVRGEAGWKATVSFCESVMTQKKSAEKEREEDVNAPPARRRRGGARRRAHARQA